MKIETNNKVILYQTEDGKTKIEVNLEDETVWLSQAQMAELFQKDVRTVSEHIRNIYEEGELEEKSSIQAKSGNSGIGLVKPTKYYSLSFCPNAKLSVSKLGLIQLSGNSG